MRASRGLACFGVAIAWCLLALGCGEPVPRGAASPAAPAALVARPRGPAIPVPLDVPASPSASPGTWQRIPFVFPIDSDRGTLALYDRASPDIYVMPGAGFGLMGVTEVTTTQYAFDDRRDVYLYDVVTEERIKLVDGGMVGGYAFAPNSDNRGYLYFLGVADPGLAAERTGWLYAVADLPGPLVGKPVAIGPVNALAALHGGVASFDVSGSGEVIVFSTADGGLYLFYSRLGRVEALIADQEFGRGFAHAVTIDSRWARFVAWEDHLRASILVLDRWTGAIDTLPEVGVVLGNIGVSNPSFKNGDPFSLIFRFTTRAEPADPRFAVYDLLSGQLILLPILDNFLEEPGRTLLSRSGLGGGSH